MSVSREHILAEIRRTAEANNGTALGRDRARINHQACANEVAVVRVVCHAPPCLDLQDGFMLSVKAVDLVRHNRSADFAEKHRTTNRVRFGLAVLDLKAQTNQPGYELRITARCLEEIPAASIAPALRKLCRLLVGLAESPLPYAC